MEICKACTELNGKPVASGRHGGLSQYYGDSGNLFCTGTECHFYICEACQAILSRQKAPPNPNAAWTLVGPVDKLQAARAAAQRPADGSWIKLESGSFPFGAKVA